MSPQTENLLVSVAGCLLVGFLAWLAYLLVLAEVHWLWPTVFLILAACVDVTSTSHKGSQS